MNSFKKAVACGILAVFCLTACATTQTGDPTFSSPEACIAAHTVCGTLIGAGVGALIGVATGKSKNIPRYAGGGAAAGAVVSFAYAWGACFAAFTKVNSKQTKGFRNAQAEIKYLPQQGNVTKISDYAIDPAAIAPGDKPSINASYYVMTPDEKEIQVTETIALKVYNPGRKAFEEVGHSSETIVVNPGKRNAVSEIPIPENAVEGKFLIVFKVATREQSDQKEMPFVITKDQVILAKAKKESMRRIAERKRQESMTDTASGRLSSSRKYVASADSGGKNINLAGLTQCVITVHTAKLRENPDKHSKIVSMTSRGARYPLLNTVTISGKKWYQVKLPGETSAWIHASLAKIAE